VAKSKGARVSVAIERVPGEAVIHLSVSWDTYETLVDGIGEGNRTRLSYDGEILELMAPYADHESYQSLLEVLLGYLVTEWDLNLYSTGSMTLKAKPVGAEPDTSFYSKNAGKVGDMDRIDLGVSPPPDLVVEIDLSRSRTDKLRLYAAMNVPEFWRLDRESLRGFSLIGDAYEPIEVSVVIDGLPLRELERFLRRRAEPDRRALYQDWQAWLRANRSLHRP